MANATNGKRPRVLYLAHRIPYPPDKGDKIRSYHEWRALADAADTTIACFVDDPADEARIEELGGLCAGLLAVRIGRTGAKARSLAALATGGPLSLAFYRSGEMRRRLAALPRFDAVLAFSSTVAPYALDVPAARRVLDLCDLDSEKWVQFAADSAWPWSWIYGTEARRLGRYEREATRAFDATLLVSEAEADTLRKDCPGSDVRVVPNGVDLAYYDPDAVEARGDGKTLVFCGAMDYRSNVDAVRYFHDEVFPRIRREIPDARFKIVGTNPAPAVQKLAETPGVEVTGRVPDVRPELLEAAVSVAPLRLGRGVPNKILEALALTLPVVTTPNGAAGLDLAAFEGAEVAGDAAGFAAAVVRRLKAGGRFPQHRAVLEERYSWRHHMDRLVEVVLS